MIVLTMLHLRSSTKIKSAGETRTGVELRSGFIRATPQFPFFFRTATNFSIYERIFLLTPHITFSFLVRGTDPF